MAAAFVIIAAGCDRAARHKILTFFFEGVPPPGGEREVVRRTVLTISGGTDEMSASPVVLDPEQAKRRAQRRGSRHQPTADCNECHVGGRRSGRRELIKPLPDLCYTCHDEQRARGERVHGPLALAGDICLFCHHPHQSGFAHLQRAPVPDLCYRCHSREDMHTIVDHEGKMGRICTDCHDPHSSPRDKLLKPYEEPKGDPNTVNLSMKSVADSTARK